MRRGVSGRPPSLASQLLQWRVQTTKQGISGRFDGLFFDWKKVLVYLFKE
jgi:hypothetical protein